MARVTNTDKWIPGGDGELRDLFVLPPLLKLTIDFVWHHPFLSAIIPLYIVYAILTDAKTALFLIIATIAAILLYRFYARYKLRQFIFVVKNRRSDSLVVPIDKKYHPKAALKLDRSVLIGGDSGTGKSNLVWQIVKELDHFLLPHVNYIIDPAGGVELADLQHGLHTQLYTDRPQEVDRLIIDFRDKMNQRLGEMKLKNIRKHIPTPEEPNYYLFIDELLLCRTQLKQGVQSPLGEVLAVGRKAGFIVIGLTQLGQKTSLGDLRDMFPQRVAFATRSQEMTDAILGTGATRGGAPCHELTSPGEGYLFTQDNRRYFKFKAPLIKDTIKIAQPIIGKVTSLPSAPIDNMVNNATVLPAPSVETGVLDRGNVAVYRLFGETGVLLYVGVAKNPEKRFKQHHDKEWWSGVDFERTTITWYPDKAEAFEAERQAIESEMPIYNIVFNNDPES
jgi:predicted GIY-YIG superfamily endonuclease